MPNRCTAVVRYRCCLLRQWGQPNPVSLRTLLRRLAGEGRTVFVSSHLMSGMAVTADHLIVIGRGRLIVDYGTADFIEQNSADAMVVRSPSGPAPAAVLLATGASVDVDGDALVVSDLPGAYSASPRSAANPRQGPFDPRPWPVPHRWRFLAAKAVVPAAAAVVVSEPAGFAAFFVARAILSPLVPMALSRTNIGW